MNKQSNQTKAKTLPDSNIPLDAQLRKSDEDILKGANDTSQLEGMKPKGDAEKESANETGAGPSKS